MRKERERERSTRASATPRTSERGLRWGRRSVEGISAILAGPRARKESSRDSLSL